MLPAQLLLFDFRCVAHFGVLNAVRQFSFAKCRPNNFLKSHNSFVIIFVFIVIRCLPAGSFVALVSVLFRREGSRVRKPTKVTTHLTNKFGFM